MKKTIGILGGMGPEATEYMFGLIIRNTKVLEDQDRGHREPRYPVLDVGEGERCPDATHEKAVGTDPAPARRRAAKEVRDPLARPALDHLLDDDVAPTCQDRAHPGAVISLEQRGPAGADVGARDAKGGQLTAQLVAFRRNAPGARGGWWARAGRSSG